MDHPLKIPNANTSHSNKSFSKSKAKKPPPPPPSPEPVCKNNTLTPDSSSKATPKLTGSSGNTTISSSSGDIQIQLDLALRPKTC